MDLKINSYNFINKNQHIAFKGNETPKNDTITPILQDRYFSIFESEKFKILTYSEPVTLQKALLDIINEDKMDVGISGNKDILRKFLLDLPDNILDIKVKGINGYGTSAIAFDMDNNKILKITNGNHFPLNRTPQEFDVPIYQSGHKHNTYYYVQEKLYQHNLPEHFTKIIKEKIKESGFKVKDLEGWASHQIGLSKEGNLYLLDSECAQYKTIFHAIADKFQNWIKNIR